MILAFLVAAGHLYVLPSKVLFMLPADEKSCGVTSVRYGPSDGKWETGSNLAAPDCHFRTWVKPGPLLPAWSDPGGKPVEGALDVTYTIHGGSKPLTATVQPEKIEPSTGGRLSAKAEKAKNTVRVEVTNKSDRPVMLGDSVAARGRPKDDCLGPGPAAVLQSGETLVDIRPGLLSKSMNIWVSEFSDEKTCKWVEVKR
ncbi:MAG: hypothetical protein ABR567_14565 [Myxococcales bacterium]